MLTLISGTNRPGSTTRKVTRYLEGVYQKLGAAIDVIDLQDLPPETFAPTSYATKPASLAPFVDKVMKADGLVVVTPEYNGGIPGILKYFIDMLPFPASLKGRPVCFVGLGAGEWGALRPVEQLQMIFSYRLAYLFPERVFIRHCQTVVSPDGTITDADLAKRLETQAQNFVTFAQRFPVAL